VRHEPPQHPHSAAESLPPDLQNRVGISNDFTNGDQCTLISPDCNMVTDFLWLAPDVSAYRKDDGWRVTVEYAKKNAGGQLWLS
jgi:hypothetical protein